MLEVRDLHAGYATARVLQGITFNVDRREAVAVLGRNGMGKTSLLRTVCGLQPPIVTGGSVRFQGGDLARLQSFQVARSGIGLVPQGRRVFRSLTVLENLRIGARPQSGGWTVGRVEELFPRLGERRRQLAGTLSGGEQQVLAIGRALMMNPQLLVMDEPSEGLAPTVIELILDRLRLLTQEGQAILLAEQNVDLALAVARRVLILGDGGRIAWAGSPAELRQRPGILTQLIGIEATA
jgi:branched-chain amino acid transport system ATP-binding protein